MRQSLVQGRGTRVLVTLVAAAFAAATFVPATTLGAQTLRATPLELTATAGEPFTGVVANLASTSCSGGCDATVDWGDGTTPPPPGAPLTGTATDDGSGGVDVTGTHTYTAAGTYSIAVTLQTCTGCVALPAPQQATSRMTVTATSPVTTPTTVPQAPTAPTTPATSGPVASLQFKPRTITRKGKKKATRTIDFTMPAQAAPGLAIDHFLWDFGDGHVSNRNVGGLLYPGREQPTATGVVTHRYSKNGAFHVTAHAVDNTGGDTALSTNAQVGCLLAFSSTDGEPKKQSCQKDGPLFPIYLKYADDPIVGQEVMFSMPAVAKYHFKVENSILKIIGTDPNGNPVWSAPQGAFDPGSPGPDITLPNFTIDFGDGTSVEDNAPNYTFGGEYTHEYAKPGVFHAVVTEVLNQQKAVFGGYVHVEGGGTVCNHNFAIRGFATVTENGGCFRRHHLGNSTATDPLDPSVTDGPRYELVAYTPAQRVDVSGLAFSGTNASGLVMDPFTGAVAGGKGTDVTAGGQLIYSGGPIPLDGNPAQFPVQGATGRVDGLPIASGTGTIVIPKQGQATIQGAALVLPPDLKGSTTGPLNLTAGQVADPAQDNGLSFGLPGNIGFGPVQIQGGTITHASGIWTGTVNIVLFQKALGGSLSFDKSGNLTGASVSYKGPPPIPVAGPVAIQGVNAAITLEHGTQAFSFSGNAVDLSIAGIIDVLGCVSFAYVNSGEHTLLPCNGNQTVTASGVYVGASADSVKLLGFNIGSGSFFASPSGISAAGHFNYSLPLGLASASGDIGVSIYPSGFYGQAGATVCIAGYLCAGGAIGVNQNGIVACANFSPPYPFPDFWVGAWVRWKPLDGDVTSGGGTCDVASVATKKLSSAPGSTESLAAGSVAAAGTNGITIAAGAPYDVIEVTGKDHSPLVKITPPQGAPIVDDGTAVQPISKKVLILHADAADGSPGLINPKTTSIILLHAKPGFWKLSTLPGSSKIVRVRRRAGMAAPKVAATVASSAKSRTHTLRWKLRTIPGQRVTFVEHADGIDHRLGSTNNASGVLHFTPADGPAGHRDIVAQVNQDGFPRTTLTVAGYDAPAPVMLLAPHVKARVHGGKLNVSWTRVRGASLYSLSVQLSDGRVLHPTIKGGTLHLRVKHVRRGAGVTVAVTPLTATGRPGTAGSVTVKAHIKKAKPLPL